jgi:hypothetical protein
MCLQVIDGSLLKIYARYDSECGYSSRVVDPASAGGCLASSRM